MAKNILSAKKSDGNLTPKQRLFCLEYLKDFNAAQAALRSKYSEKSAKVIGPENLLKPVIQAELSRLVQKQFDKAEVSVEQVIQELIKAGFADITNYVAIKEIDVIVGYRKHPDGTDDLDFPIMEKQKIVDPYLTDTIEKSKLGAISEIKQTKNGIGIKLHDKIKALELIGRYLKLWTDRVESTNLHHHTGQLSIDITIYNNKEVIDLKADLDQLQQELADSEAMLTELQETTKPDN